MNDSERCAGSSSICLQDTEVEKVQETRIEKLQGSSQHVTSSVKSTNPFSFQMPTFSPVINSNGQGTINFTINMEVWLLQLKKKPLMTF